jgi:hypothetical protein
MVPLVTCLTYDPSFLPMHDYQSIEITSSLSNSNILDLPPQSPDRTNIKPLHSSTPTRKAGPSKCASPLKIVNINFQSIKSKLCRLSNVINSIKPDIIVGTETWLDKDIKDSEICPKGYILHRKDRNSKNHRTGGRVLLAIKNEYNREYVPELDALFIALALVTDVSKFLILSSSVTFLR